MLFIHIMPSSTFLGIERCPLPQRSGWMCTVAKVPLPSTIQFHHGPRVGISTEPLSFTQVRQDLHMHTSCHETMASHQALQIQGIHAAPSLTSTRLVRHIRSSSFYPLALRFRLASTIALLMVFPYGFSYRTRSIRISRSLRNTLNGKSLNGCHVSSANCIF